MNESRVNIKSLYMRELALLIRRIDLLFGSEVSEIDVNRDCDGSIEFMNITFSDDSFLYQPIPKEEVSE